MPTMRSRVDCGLSLVMLSFWPTSRLRSVDLPAFGFPATVTVPALVMAVVENTKGRPVMDGLLKRCRRRPTLPRSLDRSTIGAAGLNARVRNGNGCGPCALVASVGRSEVSSDCGIRNYVSQDRSFLLSRNLLVARAGSVFRPAQIWSQASRAI